MGDDMKLNNKGFMLAEIVIVSAIIITTIVGLYSGFANTYKAYELRSSYYDAKTVYALKNLEDFLVDEMLLNSLVTTTNFKYIELTKDKVTDNYHKAFIDNFYTTYNINKVYLLKYSEANINEFAATLDDEFKKYLEFYLEKTGEEEDNNKIDETKYSYLLVTSTNNETYATLRIR